MAQYLEQFKNVIGKRQTQQILRLLNKKRDTGQIRTIQEFSQRLEELMRDLTSTNLKPSLTVAMAEEGEMTDSELFNDMLDRVEDDLIAAFEESDNIDEVQKSHEAIIRDVILKNLRAGVAELEAQISLYEFINQDTRGFDQAIFSTFRESKEGRTQRGGSQTQVLFTDQRRGNLFPSRQDAAVELVGERLTLANSGATFHTIAGVRQIFDSESPQSELIVEPPGIALDNMIDNAAGTYWIQSLLFTEKKEFVKVQLQFNLSGVKEVNTIEIEPASLYGLTLEQVQYIDGNNVVQDLGLPERFIESPASIIFRKIATDRIILTFRNDNPSKTRFEFNENREPLFSQAIREPPEGITPTISNVSQDLKDIIGSEKVHQVIGLEDFTDTVFQGFEFLTGIDNVRIGLANYETASVYVSAPLELCGIGELGLRVLERRPYIDVVDRLIKFTEDTYDNDSDNAIVYTGNDRTGGRDFQGSLEYFVIRQDFDSSNVLSRTTVFPILPLGVSRVHQERLVLTEKSDTALVNNDIGKTIFFSTRADGDIRVYRNGEILTDETGNALATAGWQQEPSPDVAGSTPNNNIPMRFKIKILDALPTDIYTVSYTPLLSTTCSIPQTLSQFTAVGGLQVVDLVGDLSARACEGQVVLVDKIGEDNTTQVSKIYLSVILRQNTAEATLTPMLEEYTLVAGCKDPSKFEDL